MEFTLHTYRGGHGTVGWALCKGHYHVYHSVQNLFKLVSRSSRDLDRCSFSAIPSLKCVTTAADAIRYDSHSFCLQFLPARALVPLNRHYTPIDLCGPSHIG